MLPSPENLPYILYSPGNMPLYDGIGTFDANSLPCKNCSKLCDKGTVYS